MSYTDTYFVISRYKENIDWIKSYATNYLIYNKGEELVGYNQKLQPNFGANQYDICHFIHENYENLPDVIAFLQGDPFDHCLIDRFNVLIQNKKFNDIYNKIKHEIKVGIKKNMLVSGSGGSYNIIILNDDYILKIIPKFIDKNLKKQRNNDELEAEYYKTFTDKIILKNNLKIKEVDFLNIKKRLLTSSEKGDKVEANIRGALKLFSGGAITDSDIIDFSSPGNRVDQPDPNPGSNWKLIKLNH